MLSKTSFFNRTLFRKNLSRFWPLWGMVSFIGALLPAAMLLNLSYSHIDGFEVTELYYNALVYVIPGVSLVYAIMCAVTTWEYLFFPRNVGMMHTLPIRREGIFATNFLSGMTMMLIPYVITGAMCVIVSVMLGCFALVPLLETIAGVLGLCLFYYCSATFVAFLTGNIFMLPALYFLLHFLAPLMDFLCSTYAGQFIYGLNSDYSGVVDFLSPTVYIMKTMNVETLWQDVPNPDFPGEMMSKVTGYELHGLWIIGVYALVGLALLALARLLYSRRRSECAGEVMAVRHLKPVFRFGIAALAAMTGGLLLYMLLWSSVHSKTLMDPLPLAMFMIIAGAIGYYAASMMLAKSLRVFRGSWKGMVLVAAFSLALCFSLSADVFGVGRRVPDAGDIQTLTFRAADNTYYFHGEDIASNPTESALLEQVLDLHETIAADTGYIVAGLDGDLARSVEARADESYVYEELFRTHSVLFTYRLKDGTTLSRRYSLPITRERLTQPETYDAKLDTLINSMEMRCKRLFMDQPEYQVCDGHVWMDFGNDNSFGLNDREAATVMEAVRKDALAGSWGEYTWFDDSYADRYAMSIDLNLRTMPENNGQDRSYENLYLYVNPRMEYTIAALIGLGIVDSQEELLTYAQVDFQRFSETVMDHVGKWPHELTQAELQKYCDEFGYDYQAILAHLYGEDALTSSPGTVPSIQAEVVTGIDMDPNSSSVYIS